MESDFDSEAAIASYLQSDRALAAPYLSDFARALQTIASRQGATPAHNLAARAISPLLSYSSVLKLRRWLLPKSEGGGNDSLRLAVLGGPTTVQLVQLMQAFLVAQGIAVDLYEGEFGVFRQEILDPNSGLARFQPQVVFLATGAGDVSRFPEPEHSRAVVSAMADEEIGSWVQLWETANRRWGATVIQNNFDAVHGNVFGHFALRHPAARSNYLELLNRRLAEDGFDHVILHDLHGLVAEAGAGRWFDHRLYFEAKMPCGPESLVTYAHSVASLIGALKGRSRRVLVLDLDNTLWGGQVGDVGAGGIVVGHGSAEGEAYTAFQSHVKRLRARGVLLAVCSKNDEARAREPFETRRDMVLQIDDFSCFVANWKSKPENISQIAAQLDLGLDSLVFFDDSPLERALMRRLAPSVAVPDVPADPTGYINALDVNRYFEAVTFTAEDAERTRYYADSALRREMAEASGDLGSFLASLSMIAEVEPLNPSNLERSWQLINKSNQFNLTTRRYSMTELRSVAESREWLTLTIRLRDKLGDSGLVSVVLLQRAADALLVDTWVMSCRVLQRGVEQLVYNQIVRLGRENGARLIRGVYIPTAKNRMVANHYRDLGFELEEVEGETTKWILSSPEIRPTFPTTIELRLPDA